MDRNERPLVSVIVPIFKIDRFLGHCIESIISQTYRNIEIILVDDGSPDRCPELCDLYAGKDERIRVIHKQNGGLVSARKAGLEISRGEYVTYVDGDDWIGAGHISSLVGSALTTGSDMVCAGFTRNFFSRQTPYTNPYPAGVYEGEALTELWKNMLSYGPFYRLGIYTYVWNKLFRRELLYDVQMAVDERISIGEDGAVTYPALLRCSRVSVTESVAYHYRQREDSMLKQSSNYGDEAQKLVYLYGYMKVWAKSAPEELGIYRQVVDYVLSIAVMRSGGRLPHMDYSTLEKKFCGKDVVLYSAGTFGQQVYTRLRETGYCNVKAWVDSFYVEYRRCCRDVDPVEAVCDTDHEYVLVATVDSQQASAICRRLADLGVERSKILTVEIPEEHREDLLDNFLDVEAIKAEEKKRVR